MKREVRKVFGQSFGPCPESWLTRPSRVISSKAVAASAAEDDPQRLGLELWQLDRLQVGPGGAQSLRVPLRIAFRRASSPCSNSFFR
jgi:hypothetical protein